MKKLLLATGLALLAAGPALAQAAVPAPDSPPRRVERIFIDAGHGGKDPGAVSPFGTREKDLVLDMARAAADQLSQLGFEVRLAREGDEFVPLTERSRLANEWGADLLVSFHANASESQALRGFEVYTRRDLGEETRPPALELEQLLADLRARERMRQEYRLADRVARRVSGLAPVATRRLRHADFQVLKNTESPAILVEMGYLTNTVDHERLSKPEYRRSMVDGIVDAIWMHACEYEATDGFSRTG